MSLSTTESVMSTSFTKTSKNEQESGRRTLEEIYNWPWKLEIPLELENQAKICFLSGKPRELYPENPIHSRFGIEYSIKCDLDSPTPTSYDPYNDDYRLGKPISIKGYGIGGLSAERFKSLERIHSQIKNTKPDKKLVKKLGLSTAPSLQSSVALTESKPSFLNTTISSNVSTVKLSTMAFRGSTTLNSSAALPPVLSRTKTEILKLIGLDGNRELSEKECAELARQKKVAFGKSTTSKRFANQDGGGGICSNSGKPSCKKIPMQTGFGRGPATPLEYCKINCNYQGFDECFSCSKTLRTEDYYRTIRPMSLPQSECGGVRGLNLSTSSEILLLPKPTSEIVPKLCRPKFISFCRSCFSNLLNSNNHFWTKKRLTQRFRKSRHCFNIHEHENVPVAVSKVPCKLSAKLKRMEALMNKYFPDVCDKVPSKKV